MMLTPNADIIIGFFALLFIGFIVLLFIDFRKSVAFDTFWDAVVGSILTALGVTVLFVILVATMRLIGRLVIWLLL